ncbi:hypothetical protein SAMN05421753_1222 [Planctomicrobium piriforme]|uniref:Uncharacterized protein n=1 Tax=Planctomicrobium piriforme TaxID=1576369 RepID=A0A1I3RV81_9PLAN|nr:hypothetical protein SAMN05421753_1222 [Planctomicrobium piriforme]
MKGPAGTLARHFASRVTFADGDIAADNSTHVLSSQSPAFRENAPRELSDASMESIMKWCSRKSCKAGRPVFSEELWRSNRLPSLSSAFNASAPCSASSSHLSLDSGALRRIWSTCALDRPACGSYCLLEGKVASPEIQRNYCRQCPFMGRQLPYRCEKKQTATRLRFEIDDFCHNVTRCSGRVLKREFDATCNSRGIRALAAV